MPKSNKETQERNEQWLNQKLEQIWQLIYPEVQKANHVKAVFRGRGRNKFGHIKKKGENTEIAVNSLFRHYIVPEYIIDTTLAHELTHYMHGFGSPLKNITSTPIKEAL